MFLSLLLIYIVFFFVLVIKAKHLKLKDNYEKFENKLKDKGKDWMGKWKDQLGKGNEMLHRWEEKSKEFIGNFVEMFGRDGRLVSLCSGANRVDSCMRSHTV